METLYSLFKGKKQASGPQYPTHSNNMDLHLSNHSSTNSATKNKKKERHLQANLANVFSYDDPSPTKTSGTKESNM